MERKENKFCIQTGLFLGFAFAIKPGRAVRQPGLNNKTKKTDIQTGAFTFSLYNAQPLNACKR